MNEKQRPEPLTAPVDPGAGGCRPVAAVTAHGADFMGPCRANDVGSGVLRREGYIQGTGRRPENLEG